MPEQWRQVVGFEGLYAVSSYGRIRSLPRFKAHGGIMTTSLSGRGYRKVTLCRRGEKYVHKFVHQIVLEAFVGSRPHRMEAAHNNGVRDDNRLSNLRWDTRVENFRDKRKHGTHCCGETHGRRKLSEKQVKQIRKCKGTLKEIGDRFGIGPMQVHRIKTKKNWSHL